MRYLVVGLATVAALAAPFAAIPACSWIEGWQARRFERESAALAAGEVDGNG